jgi:hypothetical protein
MPWRPPSRSERLAHSIATLLANHASTASATPPHAGDTGCGGHGRSADTVHRNRYENTRHAKIVALTRISTTQAHQPWK